MHKQSVGTMRQKNKLKIQTDSNKTKRIILMIDDSNLKKLRTIQSKMIKESSKSISFSKVLNMVLADLLK